jgi:hypothetical protein
VGIAIPVTTQVVETHVQLKEKNMSRKTLGVLLIGLSVTALATATRADDNDVITLRNKDWDHGALVEVKRGKAQNPADDPNYGSKTLQKGETWAIPCEGEEVVWRRKALGYSDETFTPWTRDSCFDSTTHDV